MDEFESIDFVLDKSQEGHTYAPLASTCAENMYSILEIDSIRSDPIELNRIMFIDIAVNRSNLLLYISLPLITFFVLCTQSQQPDI